MRLKSIKPLAIVMGVLLFFASCEKESVETLETLNEQSDLADTRKSAPITYSESEPNNTLASADGPIYGDDAIITGTTDAPFVWDWFVVPVQANKLKTVYLTGTTTYLSAVVCDKFGNIVSNVDYKKEISFLTTYTGNYYIKVHGYANHTYSISLLQSKTLPAVAGSSINGRKTSSDQTYTFTLSSPSYVTLYLSASDKYLGFKVYDSSNNLISGTTVVNDKQAIVFNELAAGTYIIKVSGYSGLVYDLYFNPQYSIVNAIYYDAISTPEQWESLDVYKCSRIGSGHYSYLGRSGPHDPNEEDWYMHDWNSVGWSEGQIWANGYYQNNFPIITVYGTLPAK